MDWQQLVLEQAALIDQLRVRIVELETEVAALKNELAVSKKHSGNSSKPPSSDIVKPPKDSNTNGKDSKNKGKDKRKRGAQKGHKQNLRKPFDASQIDKTIELKLDACPTCGHDLVISNDPPKIHQQVELACKPFLVTEFQQAWYWCEHCQCHHCAGLPSEVEKAGLFNWVLAGLKRLLRNRKFTESSIIREQLESYRWHNRTSSAKK